MRTTANLESVSTAGTTSRSWDRQIARDQQHLLGVHLEMVDRGEQGQAFRRPEQMAQGEPLGLGRSVARNDLMVILSDRVTRNLIDPLSILVFNVCRENGIMYQSFWTLSGNPSLLAHPLMRQLAEKYGITREQALFKLCSQ
jgi:hypothetical protein